MKVFFNAFAKKLFGAKYERVARAVVIYFVVFLGLHGAGVQIPVAPSVFYLMVTAFSAGVMWQVLTSKDNRTQMQNIMMLPLEEREFVAAYVAALGSYVMLTKTAALLAVLLAVSPWRGTEILGAVLCGGNGILMAAAIFSMKRNRYGGMIWMAAVLAVLFFGWERPWFIPVIVVSAVLAVLVLRRADAYSFYLQEKNKVSIAKGRRQYSVGIYFFRYLESHKNYLMNSVVLWCAACVLPYLFRQMEGTSAIPVGFAILSMNTPVCIMLSCDHGLEKAVHFLPGQMKCFCVPYGFFLFLCTLAADLMFLCSWQVQAGGVTRWMLGAACFFAMQSAVFSVLLEWFFPIRSWRIESDLWHHPRKYEVPTVMLLLAGAVGTAPESLVPLMLLLGVEITGLLLWGRRY